MERLIPGWLDKKVTWRQPSAHHMSGWWSFPVAGGIQLPPPYGKIPDRQDFATFQGRDQDRLDYWNAVVRASQRLGHDFLELAASGRIRDIVRPLPAN
jgi:hypothetical protein